jgi:Holliday junction resolvasome RuvABC endonuclease subunit
VPAGIAAKAWPEATIWRASPAEWKRAAGLKGNARKDDVAALARSLAPWIAAGDHRQDAFDALAMAYGEANAVAGAIAAETEATSGDIRAFEGTPKGLAHPEIGRP